MSNLKDELEASYKQLNEALSEFDNGERTMDDNRKQYSEFIPPKVPVASIMFALIVPVLVTVLPGLFADNTLSWQVRIIIGLSVACVTLGALFISSFLENYKISYRIQILEYRSCDLDIQYSRSLGMLKLMKHTLGLSKQALEEVGDIESKHDGSIERD